MYTFGELLGDVQAEIPDGYEWPERTLVELINSGLRVLGDLALVETHIPKIGEETDNYESSLAWKRRRPLMIDYQMGEQWVRVYDWEYLPALPNTIGLILFVDNLSGKEVRIWCVDSHPRISEDGDIVSETIAPELAIAASVERAIRWQNAKMGGGDVKLMGLWNEAKIELARTRVNFPTWTPRSVAKLLKVRGA